MHKETTSRNLLESTHFFSFFYKQFKKLLLSQTISSSLFYSNIIIIITLNLNYHQIKLLQFSYIKKIGNQVKKK